MLLSFPPTRLSILALKLEEGGLPGHSILNARTHTAHAAANVRAGCFNTKSPPWIMHVCVLVCVQRKRLVSPSCARTSAYLHMKGKFDASGNVS